MRIICSEACSFVTCCVVFVQIVWQKTKCQKPCRQRACTHTPIRAPQLYTQACCPKCQNLLENRQYERNWNRNIENTRRKHTSWRIDEHFQFVFVDRWNKCRGRDNSHTLLVFAFSRSCWTASSFVRTYYIFHNNNLCHQTPTTHRRYLVLFFFTSNVIIFSLCRSICASNSVQTE